MPIIEDAGPQGIVDSFDLDDTRFLLSRWVQWDGVHASIHTYMHTDIHTDIHTYCT